MDFDYQALTALPFYPVILGGLFWNMAWKGLALWRAARNNSKPWFIVLLIVNTLGLLEILYLLIWGKRGKKDN